MKKWTSLFLVLFLSASLFTACGDRYETAYEYDEYDEPCYANQQPNYVDGEYYIFNCGNQYRRVRRTRVVYIQDPIYIPVLTDNDRESVYREMPRTTKRTTGVQRSTGVSNPTSSAPTGTSPSTSGKSGVKRSTGTSSSTPSTSSPSRSTGVQRSTSTSGTSKSSTSSSPSRSTGVTRSTSTSRSKN